MGRVAVQEAEAEAYHHSWKEEGEEASRHSWEVEEGVAYHQPWVVVVVEDMPDPYQMAEEEVEEDQTCQDHHKGEEGVEANHKD